MIEELTALATLDDPTQRPFVPPVRSQFPTGLRTPGWSANILLRMRKLNRGRPGVHPLAFGFALSVFLQVYDI